MATDSTNTLLVPILPTVVVCLAIASVTLTLTLRFAGNSESEREVLLQAHVIKVQPRCVPAPSSLKPPVNVVAYIRTNATSEPLLWGARPQSPAERLLEVRPPPVVNPASH